MTTAGLLFGAVTLVSFTAIGVFFVLAYDEKRRWLQKLLITIAALIHVGTLILVASQFSYKG